MAVIAVMLVVMGTGGFGAIGHAVRYTGVSLDAHVAGGVVVSVDLRRMAERRARKRETDRRQEKHQLTKHSTSILPVAQSDTDNF